MSNSVFFNRTRPASPTASDMSSDWGAYAYAHFYVTYICIYIYLHMFVQVFIYVYAYASPSKLIIMLVWLQMFTWFYNENLECILFYISTLVLTNIYSSQLLLTMMKFMFTLSFTWKFYPLYTDVILLYVQDVFCLCFLLYILYFMPWTGQY